MPQTDGGQAAGATGGAGTTARWPRIHLIYFVLAAFDLIAVAAGLYLGHQAISIYNDSVTRHERWSALSSRVNDLQALAGEIEYAGTNAFNTGNLVANKAKLDDSTRQFQAAIADIRYTIFEGAHSPFDRKQVHKNRSAQKLSGLFSKATLEVDQMAGSAANMIALLEARNRFAAKFPLANMQLGRDALLQTYGQIQKQFRAANAAAVNSEKHVLTGLEKYEIMIGAMIVIMVLCVATYGHVIGRLVKRKYLELEAAHADTQAFAAELETANIEVTALNASLAENITQLHQAQDDIIRKGKMAQLGQLTATVAHDLRNPLGVAKTAAYLLERKYGGTDPNIGKQLTRINTGIERCNTIITELLDFTRTSEVNLEDVALDKWLLQLVQDQAGGLPAELAIECVLGLGDKAVPFDQSLMQRAVINFLSNAKEALLGKGDVKPEVETVNPKVVIGTRLSERGVELYVRDNGPGMSEEMLEKVMQPLFTTKKYGVGLGLPAVEKIFDQHGGGIEIVSTAGNGTCVTGWWPLATTGEGILHSEPMSVEMSA